MSGSRTARGFTLIELLVTIGVIAIAVSVGVPAWSSFTQGSAVSGASSELISALNDARSMAVAERGTIEVRAMGGDWNQGLEIYRLNVVSDASDDELLFSVQRTAGGKVAITEDANSTDVRFDRYGRLTAGRGFDIDITGKPSGSPTRRLEISPFGRVQVTSSYAP